MEHLKLLLTGKHVPFDRVRPTIGFNKANLQFENSELLLWDLGGKEDLRSMWQDYYNEIDALVYMLDAASEQLEESIKVLSK